MNNHLIYLKFKKSLRITNMVLERNSDLKRQCEYDMCNSQAEVVCESQLLYTHEWSGCGKNLCDTHSNQNEFFAVIGFARCKDG